MISILALVVGVLAMVIEEEESTQVEPDHEIRISEDHRKLEVQA